MNAIHTASVASSEMSDLDGYSAPADYTYSLHSHFDHATDDFGFDPPQPTAYAKVESFSPATSTDPSQLSRWSGFDASNPKGVGLVNQIPTPPDRSKQHFDMDSLFTHTTSQSASTMSRFGQVTPPRSNSTASEDKKNETDLESTKTGPTDRRKRSTKPAVKEETESTQTTTTSRKRKSTRKMSSAKEEQDDKRRQSLEKNRLAAAKCRINKKEKTEQLQRTSHDRAVHNAFLKEQVMRMKEEVQQMNALLLAHANCNGCKSPEEIQKHLANLGNEFFTQHMSYDEYPSVNFDEMSHMVQDSPMRSDYFGGHNSNSNMLNPPLPDFDRAAEFEVHTPLNAD